MAIEYRACERANRFRPSVRQTHAGNIRSDQDIRGGKEVRKAAACSYRRAKLLHQAAGQNRCAFYRDLLPEYSADSKLKTVPAARHSRPRVEGQMFCQEGIGAEMRGNLEWVGVEVEHAAHAIDDHEKPSGIKMNADGNRIASFLKRSFDAATRSVQGDRSAITTLLDHFDARRSAGREKPQHPIPVVRRAEAEPKNGFIFRLRLGARDKSADVSRSPAIHRANCGVEAANASEAGGERNLLHGQRRFVDELLGEMQTARLRNRVGRGTKMLHEQATKVTGSDTQAAGKGVHTAIFEPAFTDQPQGARNRR